MNLNLTSNPDQCQAHKTDGIQCLNNNVTTTMKYKKQPQKEHKIEEEKSLEKYCSTHKKAHERKLAKEQSIPREGYDNPVESVSSPGGRLEPGTGESKLTKTRKSRARPVSKPGQDEVAVSTRELRPRGTRPPEQASRTYDRSCARFSVSSDLR